MTNMQSKQISIQFGNWEKVLGKGYPEFQRQAECFMRGYASGGRGVFERGRAGAAMLDIAGETVFYAFLKAQGIYKREARLCLDVYELLRDAHETITENEWIAIYQLMTRPKIKRELFRDAVQQVIGDTDPIKRAEAITTGWDEGAYQGDPPERDIEDKARALLETAGFDAAVDCPLSNGTRADIVATRSDINAVCECKASLTLPELEKALGQLRAYSYELPSYGQILFYGKVNPQCKKLIDQAQSDGVLVLCVHEEQAVLAILRRAAA
jgi:hypothetical protein